MPEPEPSSLPPLPHSQAQPHPQWFLVSLSQGPSQSLPPCGAFPWPGVDRGYLSPLRTRPFVFLTFLPESLPFRPGNDFWVLLLPSKVQTQ